jgi:hypothetical protein
MPPPYDPHHCWVVNPLGLGEAADSCKAIRQPYHYRTSANTASTMLLPCSQIEVGLVQQLDAGSRSTQRRGLHRLPGESGDAMRDRISALHRRVEFAVFDWIGLAALEERLGSR